jgi:hypothetical protein
MVFYGVLLYFYVIVLYNLRMAKRNIYTALVFFGSNFIAPRCSLHSLLLFSLFPGFFYRDPAFQKYLKYILFFLFSILNQSSLHVGQGFFCYLLLAIIHREIVLLVVQGGGRGVVGWGLKTAIKVITIFLDTKRERKNV